MNIDMTSHPKIKLVYFNTRGRAESIRYLLAYAGVPYEDVRLTREEWNSKVKPTIPFGQLPALYFNGAVITQSTAILRFLAKQFNLAGQDDLERGRADMLLHCLGDVMESKRSS